MAALVNFLQPSGFTASKTDSLESDELYFHELISGPRKFIAVVDIGSNSVKLEVFEVVGNHLVSRFKLGEHCGIGKSIDSDAPHLASLNVKAANHVTDYLLPIFKDIIHHIKFDNAGCFDVSEMKSKTIAYIHANAAPKALDKIKKILTKGHRVNAACAYATEAARLSAKSIIKSHSLFAHKFMQNASDVLGFRAILASDKLEIDLCIGAAENIGAPDEIKKLGMAKDATVAIYHFGGGSGQIILKIKGYIYETLRAVVHAGSRTVLGKKGIPGIINRAIQKTANFLNSKRAKNIDSHFEGGTCRPIGVYLKWILEGVSPVDQGLPLEGYTFTINTKDDYTKIIDTLNLAKKMKCVADELFKRALTIPKAELEQMIDVARIAGEKHITLGNEEISLKKIEKNIGNYEKRFGQRAPYLSADIEIVLTCLKKNYGNGDHIPERGVNVTFGGGNARRTAAAWGAGLH